jgi:hypothetical protein
MDRPVATAKVAPYRQKNRGIKSRSCHPRKSRTIFSVVRSANPLHESSADFSEQVFKRSRLMGYAIAVVFSGSTGHPTPSVKLVV